MSPTCGRRSTSIWTNPRRATYSAGSRSSPKPWNASGAPRGSRRWRTPSGSGGTCPSLLPELCDAGLNAIEAYHSDHGERETGMYLELARKYGLLVTGGSDFHGALKPEIQLGSGCGGNLRIPREVLEKLRAR